MTSTPASSAGLATNLSSVPENTPQYPPSPTSSAGWPSSASSTCPSPRSPSAPTTQVLTYPEAIAKGRRLLDLMLTPSTTAPTFTSASQLKDWGYTTTMRTIHSFHAYHALLRLIVPNGNLDAKQVTSVHTTPLTASNNTVIPPTDAHFTNIFDLSAGILIAGSNFGPAFTMRHRGLQDGEAYPELRHWSDMAYLQALFLSSDEHRVPPGTVAPSLDAVRNLRCVVRHDIENTDTNAVVHEIVQRCVAGSCEYIVFDKACPYCSRHLAWPGLTFEMQTEEAMALLGTPNGSGIAWLLSQHGEWFGRKRLEKVTVWCDVDKTPLKPSLLFHIEDVVVVEGEEDVEGLVGKVENLKVEEVKDGKL